MQLPAVGAHGGAPVQSQFGSSLEFVDRHRKSVFVLNLWRSDARARSNLVKFLQIDGRRLDLDLLVLNKTGYELKALSGISMPRGAEELSVPHDENYWVSHRRIDWLRWDWVTTAHDDDHWAGAPSSPPSAPPSSVSLPARGPHDAYERRFPHVALFYGAIRTHVYSRFCDFASSPPEKYAGMDTVLSTWLRILGVGRPLPSYTYFYDARNWIDWASCRENHGTFAIQEGWGDYASLEAMRWTTYLDLVASLTELLDLVPGSLRGKVVKTILGQYPPFWPARGRAVLRYAPAIVRASWVVSRGSSRHPEAWRKALHASHRVDDPVWRLLYAGPRRGAVSGLADVGSIIDDLATHFGSAEDEPSKRLMRRITWWQSSLREVLDRGMT